MQAADTLAPQDSERLRRTMVDCQLRTFELTNAAVLEAFEAVPREKFVGAANAAIAYSDAVLRVRAGSSERALLAPMVLARMLQGADIKRTDRVLDVGGALGYSAAILARLAAEVTSLDSDAAFTAGARAVFAELGIANAAADTGPLDKGGSKAPYDVILVNGAIEQNYEGLIGQLAPGGRMIAVIRQPGQTGRAAKAMRFERLATGVVSEKWLFDAAAETLEPFRRVAAFAF